MNDMRTKKIPKADTHTYRLRTLRQGKARQGEAKQSKVIIKGQTHSKEAGKATNRRENHTKRAPHAASSNTHDVDDDDAT